MVRQLRVCGMAISLMLSTTSFAAEKGEHPYAEP